MKLRIPVLVIGGLCAATSVSAADRKAYHAGRCDYGYGNTYGIQRDSIKGIRTVAPVRVVCPLIRDRLETTTSLNNIEVEGYSPGSSGYSCSLYSQDEDANAGLFIDVDTFTMPPAGRFAVGLDVDSSGPGSSGNEGTYALMCDLPSGVEIYHIYVSEDDVGGVN